MLYQYTQCNVQYVVATSCVQIWLSRLPHTSVRPAPTPPTPIWPLTVERPPSSGCSGVHSAARPPARGAPLAAAAARGAPVRQLPLRLLRL
eukprot:COSAG01_NODE_25949_length_728_cov_0.874404_1_plen_90_part_01